MEITWKRMKRLYANEYYRYRNTVSRCIYKHDGPIPSGAESKRGSISNFRNFNTRYSKITFELSQSPVSQVRFSRGPQVRSLIFLEQVPKLSIKLADSRSAEPRRKRVDCLPAINRTSGPQRPHESSLLELALTWSHWWWRWSRWSGGRARRR